MALDTRKGILIFPAFAAKRRLTRDSIYATNTVNLPMFPQITGIS